MNYDQRRAPRRPEGNPGRPQNTNAPRRQSPRRKKRAKTQRIISVCVLLACMAGSFALGWFMGVDSMTYKGDILLVTQSGLGIRFKLDTISSTGRTTAGVKGITLEDDDTVGWFELPKAGDVLLVVSDRGYGKRMLADDIDRQGRAGKGQKLLPITKNGAIGYCLAGCVDVTHATGVIFAQKMGHTSTLGVNEIPVQRRTGKGELLVSVLLDDVVVYAGTISG